MTQVQWEDSATINGVTIAPGDDVLFEWPARKHVLEGKVHQIGPMAITVIRASDGKHHFVIRDRIDRIAKKKS